MALQLILGVRYRVKRLTVLNVFLILSISVWGVVLSSIIVNAVWVPTFNEVGHLEVGCYLTDALWFYVKCNGLAWSGIGSFFLTLPYLLYPPLVALNPLIAILWFFLSFPVWYIWRRKWRRT